MQQVDSAVTADLATEPHPLALALAAMPEVWRSLLIDHERDSYGRCAACRTSGTPGVPWPCTLRVAAEDARDLSDRAVSQSRSGVCEAS